LPVYSHSPPDGSLLFVFRRRVLVQIDANRRGQRSQTDWRLCSHFAPPKNKK
jgi:hypothetical protein